MESAKIKELIDEIADGNISRFAQRVGVNRVTVHRWLKGESAPRGLALEKLGKLAKRRKK
jgi:DNA-binding transcriptional regulator YiaG